MKNINEGKPIMKIGEKTSKNPQKVKELSKKYEVVYDEDADKDNGSDTSSTSTDVTSYQQTVAESINEIDAIIEPHDKETIKYLSNVKDSRTGEMAKPFFINDKKYQIIRGITPSKEVVMAVFCHNEVNDAGENLIHPVDYFEKNIVGPLMEKEEADKKIESKEKESKEKSIKDTEKDLESLNLSRYKYFFVNKKTGKTRKFKNAADVAKATIDENEEYMELKDLKKFYHDKIFGNKKESNVIEITEAVQQVAPATGVVQPAQPAQPAVEPTNIKSPLANKFITLLKKNPVISKVMTAIKKSNKVTKIESMTSVDGMLGNDKTTAPLVGAALKQMATKPLPPVQPVQPVKSVPNQTPTPAQPPAQPVQPAQPAQPVQPVVPENKVITKAGLIESFKKVKVIKTIKVKNIK